MNIRVKLLSLLLFWGFTHAKGQKVNLEKGDVDSFIDASTINTQIFTLTQIRDDFAKGKKLVSAYYDLVYQALAETNPNLLEDALVKVREARTLLGMAYTREKAYQGLHPEDYDPLTLESYQSWIGLADGLSSGRHIADLQKLSAAQGIDNSRQTIVHNSPGYPLSDEDFWVYGKDNAGGCGEFFPLKDCGANPLCLKIKFCVISETSSTVTLTAEIQPENTGVCFGGSSSNILTIYYDGKEEKLSWGEFKRSGFTTKQFTIDKSIPFGDGKLIWNAADKMFELRNDYPSNGSKTTAGTVILVRC